MKKIITAVIILLLFVMPKNAFAMADSAECACVINALTGEVVFEKNMTAKHAMASTTKIMTAILALEKCGADEDVTVSYEAAAQEGSAAYIEPNDIIKMRDLIYGLMLNSGNDAAFAIAEHISGGSEEFAALMNKKAEEIGMKNTHFTNPSGLFDDEHYSSAEDMAYLASYAMKNETFREIVSSTSYTAPLVNSDRKLYFKNHNKMLTLYQGATGIKTGYTKKSGRCLVSSAMRDGMEFIAVTLNSPNDWEEHAQMLDYAFSKYYPKTVVEKSATMKTALINGKKYNFIAAEDFIIPLKESGGGRVEVITHMAKYTKAPINKGEKAGYVEIKYNGVIVGNVDIVSEEDIYGDDEIRTKTDFTGFITRFLKDKLEL